MQVVKHDFEVASSSMLDTVLFLFIQIIQGRLAPKIKFYLCGTIKTYYLNKFYLFEIGQSRRIKT